MNFPPGAARRGLANRTWRGKRGQIVPELLPIRAMVVYFHNASHTKLHSFVRCPEDKFHPRVGREFGYFSERESVVIQIAPSESSSCRTMTMRAGARPSRPTVAKVPTTRREKNSASISSLSSAIQGSMESIISRSGNGVADAYNSARGFPRGTALSSTLPPSRRPTR